MAYSELVDDDERTPLLAAEAITAHDFAFPNLYRQAARKWYVRGA